jgi:hypothetical protein
MMILEKKIGSFTLLSTNVGYTTLLFKVNNTKIFSLIDLIVLIMLIEFPKD